MTSFGEKKSVMFCLDTLLKGKNIGSPLAEEQVRVEISKIINTRSHLSVLKTASLFQAIHMLIVIRQMWSYSGCYNNHLMWENPTNQTSN